ncbi:MAG: ABC transporter permease [Ruminococcaceae bacterium]|nr:ABC transporter permease [Oscillospiraceae bacterium]
METQPKKQDRVKKEPLIRLVKRDALAKKKVVLIYAIAIVASLVLSALICALFSSKNPLSFFGALFEGAFGSPRRIWLLLQDTALLLGVAVALVPAFKMKFWNLGGNGQILVGGLAAISCMYYLGGKISDALLIPLMIVASILAGAVWGVLPAIFKAFFDTNESLFTLMLNYIATGLVSMFITIWVKSGSGILEPLKYGNFPGLFGSPYLLTILVFFILAALMYVYLRYTKHGYEISVVGDSPNTAKYIGIDVKRVIIRTMIISGALAGVVGLFLAGGIHHTISTASANNMGFTAIMATWLAAFNPLVMMGTCFFIIFISRGMVEVRADFGFTNDSIANIVIGLVYFCVIACSFFITYRVVFRKTGAKTLESDEKKGENAV